LLSYNLSFARFFLRFGVSFLSVNNTHIVLQGARYLLLYLYVQQTMLFSLLSFVYTQRYIPYTSHIFLFSLFDDSDCVSTHLKEFDDGCTLIKSNNYFARNEVLIRSLTNISLSFHLCVCVCVCRVYLVLIVFSFVWTWPIDQINNLILNPALFGKILGISYNTAVRYMSFFSGLGQSLLFSVCPTIFRFLSCIEGSSASMEQAEQKAMIYFWYFYIVARFMGPVLLNATQSYTQNEEGTIEETVINTVAKLTSEIPKSLGPSALTYIIFSALINWPAFYLLQSGNFITKFLRMDWLNNYIMKGGGIGRDVPYRIYVDSGYISACLISMAPVVPLLGPFCLLHLSSSRLYFDGSSFLHTDPNSTVVVVRVLILFIT
jgi:hypothetical protein